MKKKTNKRRSPRTELARQFDQWLAARRDLGKRSRADYARDRDRIADFFLTQGASSASQVTRTMAEAYVTMLEKRGRHMRKRGERAGLDPKTVKKHLAIVASFFDDLAGNEVIDKDPFARVRAPKLPKRTIHCPTFEEGQRIIESIPQGAWLDARLRLLLAFALHTGARISEILGCDWGDFNWNYGDHGAVTLDGKGDKERVVPLSAWFARELQQYQRQWAKGKRGLSGQPVFVGRKGGRLEEKSVYAAIERRKLRTTYGLHPHLLRHTFGSTLASLGVRVEVIAELMGHVSLASAQIYIHTTAAQTKLAIRQLDWVIEYLPDGAAAALPAEAAEGAVAAAPSVVYGQAHGIAHATTYVVIPAAPVVRVHGSPLSRGPQGASVLRRVA